MDVNTNLFFYFLKKCAHLHPLHLTYPRWKHLYESEMWVSLSIEIQIPISSCLLDISLTSVISNLTWSDLYPQTQNLLLPLSPSSQRMASRAFCLLRYKPCTHHWSLSFTHTLYESLIWNDPCPHLLCVPPPSPTLLQPHWPIQTHQAFSCLRAFSLLFPQPDTQISQLFPQISSLLTWPSCLNLQLS